MLDKWWKKLILEEKKIVYKLTSWQFSSISGELPRATSAWFRRARSHIWCQCTWQTHFDHLREKSFSRVASFCQSTAVLSRHFLVIFHYRGLFKSHVTVSELHSLSPSLCPIETNEDFTLVPCGFQNVSCLYFDHVRIAPFYNHF